MTRTFRPLKTNLSYLTYKNEPGTNMKTNYIKYQ